MGVFINPSNGIPLMVSLELPYIGNQRNISSIPKGIYLCKYYESKKYKQAYEVLNVVGRSNILIHKGNKVSDTDGCILVGSEFGIIDNEPAILNSSKAFKELYDIIGKEDFELIIS
jgi:hypothetical protein